MRGEQEKKEPTLVAGVFLSATTGVSDTYCASYDAVLQHWWLLWLFLLSRPRFH